MKKVMLVVSILFLLIISCKSKSVVVEKSIAKEINYIPYYLKVYEADSLFIVGDFERSYQILDSLFKIYEPLQMRNYYEVTNYFKLKIILNKHIKVEDFSKLISKFNLTDEVLKNDSLFSFYYLSKKKYFEKNYQKLRNTFNSSININLRNEIRLMTVEDQVFRQKGNYQQEKQEKIDSINSLKLIKIFNNYGYPSEYVIGNSMIDNNFVEIGGILLHTSDKERVEYFMPKVLNYIKQGKAPPLEYALMKDQYNLYNGEKQYYGSYSMSFDKIGTSLIELNNRRKTIGLPNYGYEDWRFKTLYPDEYKFDKESFKKLLNKN